MKFTVIDDINEEKIVASFRLPKPIINKINYMCKATGVGKSTIVALALNELFQENKELFANYNLNKIYKYDDIA